MVKNRLFTALAALSLALGIGANTAIYSFMDSILLRSLPVSDPASLVVVKWQRRASAPGTSNESVMRSMDGRTYRDPSGIIAGIFPFPAFERLKEASAPVLSSLFAHKPAGRVNVMIKSQAEIAQGEYVSGDFFRGLAVSPAAGRLIFADDDRASAAPVAVLSLGYGEQRFGDAASAIGQQILINNVPFTVVGVTPREFFGVDPAAAPQVYLPMHASLLFDPGGGTCLPRPELLLGRDDGPVASWRWPRAGSGSARGPVRPVGGHDGDQRSRARQSSSTAPRGRGRWTRQPQAPGTRNRSTCC